MYYIPHTLVNANVKIALVGAGGTGSYFAIELVKLATAMRTLSPESSLEVTIFDGGIVTEANCIRQNFYATQIGLNKADAITWVTNNLHSMNFKSVGKNIKPSDLDGFDLIITCVDLPSIRYQIYQYFNNSFNAYRKVLWLDTGNTENSGQLVLGEFGNNKYLPTVCDLYDYSILSDKKGEHKSCSAIESLTKQNLGVNAFCARLGGQLLCNLFLKGRIKNHGAYFDCEELSSYPLNIDLETWKIHGYKPKFIPK